jgi:phage terminase large subunit-like protein
VVAFVASVNSDMTSEISAPSSPDLPPLPDDWNAFLYGTEHNLDELQDLDSRVSHAAKLRKLDVFTPYPKQAEFFEAGATNRVRLLLCANRFGKTFCAAHEVAYHALGAYPEWWQGKRFDEPVTIWVANTTAERTRDVNQLELIGPPTRRADWGTGALPRASLDLDHVTMLHGTGDAIDTISVKHVSGGWSTLTFKSFARKREAFQGSAVHVLHLDEECDLDIYDEALTRTATTKGICLLTFTPLSGLHASRGAFPRRREGSSRGAHQRHH